VTLTWSNEHGSDPNVIDYGVWYDQAGKAQLVADLTCPPDSQVACTSYTDTGLTNGQQYCYKVTSYSALCESGFSNILCATPVQPGQQVTVPDVTGQLQADAEASIIAANLVVGTVATQYSEIDAGLVISQEPTGGTLVPRDSAVDLVVSLGPAPDCSQYDGNETACRADPTCRWHKKTQTCRNR